MAKIKAGSLVVIGKAVGLLIPDPLYGGSDELGFVSISRKGNTRRVTKYDWSDPFEIGSDAKKFLGEITPEMKIAIRAIKSAHRC